MSTRVEVQTQAELDAALLAGNLPVLVGYGPFVIQSGSPTVVANGSSQPRVVANGSSQPTVVAYGICQLKVSGKVKVTAGALVAIAVLSGKPDITGGGFVSRKDLSTPAAWCEFYGVQVTNGVAVVFKGTDENFQSFRSGPLGRVSYAPGTVPVAPDWDGGRYECGGGLHFSPRPLATLEFSPSKRFLACPVALSDMAVHPDGNSPQKCKARGLHVSAWEVDRDGNPLPGAVVTWPPAKVAAERKARKPGAKKRAAKAKRP